MTIYIDSTHHNRKICHMDFWVRKCHPITNLMALLITVLWSRNKNGLKILRFYILRVSPIQISTKKCRTLSFFEQILLYKYKFKAFPITKMWQVYTRPTSASDFFTLEGAILSKRTNILLKTSLFGRFFAETFVFEKYFAKKIFARDFIVWNFNEKIFLWKIE
jgi:hypothetical protein